MSQQSASSERISVREVRFAIKACATAAERAKASAAADEAKKAAMMGVFERLLGVKSEKDVAALDAKEIGKMAKRRLARGEVELDGFSLDELLKVIQQSSCRRNVSWKDAFIAELGESKAEELTKGTAETHSYKFVDATLGEAEAHAQAIGATAV